MTRCLTRWTIVGNKDAERHTGKEPHNDYIRPANFDPSKVGITRKRFSTTQGETLLTYDGARIGQYGDDPTLSPDGTYHQRDATFWTGIALREALVRGMLA